MARRSRKAAEKGGNKKHERSLRVANEILGILFLTLSGFTLLCLVTHHPADPTSFHYSGNAKPKNLLGPAGAMVSDWLLNLWLGYAAFVIPIIFAFVAASLFGWIRWSVGIIRGFLFALAVLALSGFLQILNWKPVFDLNNPGGMLGRDIYRLMEPIFGVTGSGLILFGLTLLFAVAASGLVFSTALAKVGQFSWMLVVSISRAAFNGIKFLYGRFKQEKGAEPKRPKPKGKPRLEPKEAAPLPESPVPEFKEPKTASEAEPVKVKILDKLPDVETITEDYVFPPIDLLYSPPTEKEVNPELEKELEATAHQIEEKMLYLGIEGKVEKIWPGPVLTTFEYEPDPKIPIDKVLRVVKDIQLSLGRHGVRIIVPLPGSPRKVGIEVPNSIRETVYLKDVINSKPFKNNPSPLTIAMGKDIFGNPYVADLAKMPHLLVAGTTGSGKSVFLNCAILSFIYKAHPSSLKMILIDPKMLEFSHYEGIPHLMHPVVTDSVEAVSVLKWAVEEMDRRYRVLAEAGARDISSYITGVESEEENSEIDKAKIQKNLDGDTEEVLTSREKLPYLVIIVDEFADLMAVAPREIEQAVIRLSQKARAAGIHLILATQRPSVDVITGLIKANFPARISFKLRTKIDSRTILDVGGADDLLGFGDMFFLPSTSGNMVRLHAAFVSPQEIEQVVKFVRRFAPKRAEKIEQLPQVEDIQKRRWAATNTSEASEDEDELYEEVLEFAFERGVISTTMIQNRFRVGYVKAARIIQRMEDDGLIGPPESGGRPRKVLKGPSGGNDESVK